MSKEAQIEDWIQEILDETDCFIVSSKLGTDANYKFFIDSDTGFSLEKSVKINRALRNRIDDSGLFPDGNYSLEISSPGIDEPIRLPRQYKKNVGRLLEIKTLEEELLEGRLIEVMDEALIIETKGTKKEPKKTINIKMNNIKTATVQVEFK